MIFCKNTIFAFLLIGALFCYSHAELYPDEVLIDTTYKEQSSSSKTGLVIGSVLTGIGVVFFIAAATYTPDKEDNKKSNTHTTDCGNSSNNACLASQFADTFKDFELDLGGAFWAGIGFIFALIGVPILIYNIVKNSFTSDHPIMNDDFVYSPERRNLQKSSVQIQFTPTINFMNSSAGFNATLRF